MSELYGDTEVASREIARSVRVLRSLGEPTFRWPQRRGKVAVLLPDHQPLYALVSQVILAATVSEQVRATTSFGRLQQVTMKIFDWLAESMGARVSRAADQSTQQWQAEALGSMMLVHPASYDANMRLSMALPVPPDAILWSGPVAQARQVSQQAGGCAVFMPHLANTFTVVADQPASSLSRVAASVASGMTRHAYRVGGMPAAILLHNDVAARFIAQLLHQLQPGEQVQPLRCTSSLFVVNRLRLVLRLRSLTSADRASSLAPASPGTAAWRVQQVNMLSYRQDEDLSMFFDGLQPSPVQVSLFGASPAVTVAVPVDRLRLGQPRNSWPRAAAASTSASAA